MVKVFLLGASGQLGKEWQRFFAADETSILLPYTSAQLDITDTENVRHELREHQPDIIINCAAYTNVDGAESHTDKAEHVNGDAVGHLADLSAEFNAFLVHFSTDYVFSGDAGDRRSFPDGYPEDHSPNPVNCYGATKWKGEEAVRASGCAYLILRVSWLCGAHGDNFVTKILSMAAQRDELRIVADQYASPTFASELVAATWKLVQKKEEGTFHFTSDGIIHWAAFARAIVDEAGADTTITEIASSEFSTDADRPLFSKLNCDKVKRAGITTTDWTVGLRELIQQIQN